MAPGSKVKIILLDIEGTTTPVDFVYGTLFPYARERMNEFMARHVTLDVIEQLRGEYEADSSRNKPEWNNPPIGYLLWLMDQDTKSPALKRIQGLIWESGYKDGTLKGVVFDDVREALQRWTEVGLSVCIYSSGSVLAQKLLFKNSESGDLTKYISDYFDTEVGAKQESASYKEIARRLKATPEQVLFISDSAAECDAASSAGMNVRYSVRPGNKVEQVEHTQLKDFNEVTL